VSRLRTVEDEDANTGPPDQERLRSAERVPAGPRAASLERGRIDPRQSGQFIIRLMCVQPWNCTDPTQRFVVLRTCETFSWPTRSPITAATSSRPTTRRRRPPDRVPQI
jgi:hypothetical protein